MSEEEDKALIELSTRLLADARSPGASPSLKFRERLIEHIAVFETACESERERKKLERLGRVDKLTEDLNSDVYWTEIELGTVTDSIWHRQEATYNIHKANRPPPPSIQSTLSYE